MRESSRFALLALAFAALALLGSGCAEKEASASTKSGDVTAPAEAPAPAPRAANVRVVELAPGRVSVVATGTGVAAASSDIVYSAELAGKIVALPVEIGDRVRAGQVLARIDVDALRAQASQVEAAYSLSKSTLARLEALEADEFVSAQQMDEVRSQMASAESQRALFRTQLSRSTVRADKAGVVANVFAERAEYVGPGSPIAQVVDLRRIIVETHLAETQIAGIAKGARAEVEFDALGEVFAGEVEAVVPAADKESGTFAVRVKVDNLDERILVGMSARVRIAVREIDDVIAVPQSAVIEGEDGRSVFVAVEGKAAERVVTLGPTDGDRVVLQDGVRVGERLIVVGQRDLADGQAIAVVE